MPLPPLSSFLKHLLFQFLKTNEFFPHMNFLMLPNRLVEMGTFIYMSGHVSTRSKRRKEKGHPCFKGALPSPHFNASASMCETVFVTLGGPWRQDVDLGLEFISRLCHIW